MNRVHLFRQLRSYDCGSVNCQCILWPARVLDKKKILDIILSCALVSVAVCSLDLIFWLLFDLIHRLRSRTFCIDVAYALARVSLSIFPDKISNEASAVCYEEGLIVYNTTKFECFSIAVNVIS